MSKAGRTRSTLPPALTLAAALGIVLVGAPSRIEAQAGLTAAEVEAAIGGIRADFAEVTSALDDLELAQKTYFNPGGNGTVSTWRDASGVRKMAVEFHGDGASGLREYFFVDGELFFVFDGWETFQIWPDQPPDEFGETQNRFYIQDGAIVRWLRQAFDEERGQRQMPPDHERWFAFEESLPENAVLWLRFSESPEGDFEAFLAAIG